MSLAATLFMLLSLQFKHLLADYVFQSHWMVMNKGRYLHPGGIAHAGAHAGASLVVLLLFGVAPGLALAICAGELLVHYHIDFAKDRIQKWRNPDPKNREYWIWHGVDQFAHQATLLGIAALVLLLG